MKKWAREVNYTSKEDIYKYCVCDADWQVFRKSLKGVSTEKKLSELDAWWIQHDADINERARVQIDNYINALKRGGQLDLEGNVVR